LAFLIFAVATPAQAQTPVSEGDLIENQFVITGFVGPTHSGDTDTSSVGYGAAFDYLRNGRYGFEVLTGFSPNLDLQLAATDDSQVNNYMFNVIGAIPLGDNGGWQPYASGGIGAMTFRSGLTSDLADLFNEPDDTRLAYNFGFGLMGFADKIGFRADVRYFMAQADDNPGSTDSVFLPFQDVNFWRSTAGIAIRW
jgi:hypothetical protein